MDFFSVLRRAAWAVGLSHRGSRSNIPAEKRVPICVSYNKNGYFYRRKLEIAESVEDFMKISMEVGAKSCL